MKHARALRLLLEADVEPDRGVERRELVDEDRLQLGLEGLGLLLVGEVAALAAPGADRGDDAADHLLHARLAVGRAHAAAEVLLGDDVRGRLRPELRELDALLLEDRLVLAGDERVAHLPLDLLERVAAGDREVAPDGDVLCAVDDFVRDLVECGFCGLFADAIPLPPGLSLVTSAQAAERPSSSGPARLGVASDGSGKVRSKQRFCEL